MAMLGNDDEYFWAKNIRPDPQDDRNRNTATSYIMRDLKRTGLILKTYHVESGEGQWGEGYQKKMDKTVLSQDLVPYVRYSVNKKKRWEIIDDTDRKTLLEQLQNNHNGMEVVVAERSSLLSLLYHIYFGYPQYLTQFRIRHFHQLLSDDTYEHLTTNSILGQPIEHFRSPKKNENDLNAPKKAGKTVIAYHFITPTKNYEELMKDDFCPGSSDRWCKHRTLAHERRTENMLDAINDVKFGEFENLNEEVDMVDDYTVYDKYPPPREFYNLEDHIIDKFVFVKRVRNRNSTCSSAWSVVSSSN